MQGSLSHAGGSGSFGPAAAAHESSRAVNRFIAFAASEWIAGPTKEVVEQALTDRRDPRHQGAEGGRRALALASTIALE